MTHVHRVIAVFLGLVILTEPPAASGAALPLADRVRAIQKAIVAFQAGLFAFREDPTSPTPHIDILFEVDERGGPVHPHHLPSWIRIALDRKPPVEYSYTDAAWHALANGALQLIATVPVAAGSHTLSVGYKVVDRNGKTYLKLREFSFDVTGKADHRVVRFRSDPNQEPLVTLHSAGDSLFHSPALHGDVASRLGRFAAETGDHGVAASWFLADLKRSPKGGSDAAFRLAEAYAEIGLDEEADRLLEPIARDQSDPTASGRAWFLIERIAFQAGRHDRVLEAHDRLGPAVPSDVAGEAHTMAGLSALAQRAYARAAALFRSVPKASPDGPLSMFGHAQALSGLGDGFTASALFRKVVESRSIFGGDRPTLVGHAHAALGFQWLAQGRYEESLTELAQVPATHPAYEGARFGIGWVLRQLDEHVKAIAIFQELLDRFPQGAYAHEARILIAASYADLRAPTRSIKAYRAALDALAVSLAWVERRRDLIGGTSWNPLIDEPSTGPRDAWRALRNDTEYARSLDGYRRLVALRRDLQLTLDHFPADLAASRSGATTLSGRMQATDGPQQAAEGRDLAQKTDAIIEELRQALGPPAKDALGKEQTRLEEWSAQAALGIARNLRDEIGGEGLILE